MTAITEFLLQFAESGWAPFALLAHSYLESFFLPGAHDFFIIAVTIFNPNKFLIFACASTIGSVLGGSSAYLAGYVGESLLIQKFVPKKIVETIEHSYERFGLWAVAFAGFTPVPYKIFALTSGLFRINYTGFLIVSICSRFARFILVAGIIRIFGKDIQAHLLTSFNIFSILALSMLAILFFILQKSLKKKKEQGDAH